MGRPSLAGWTDLGVPVPPWIGGVALLACPAALLLALAPVGEGVTLAVVTLVVATLLELPGVPLAAMVGAVILAVVRTSRWRAGDLSLLGLALVLGAGTAYLLDNVRYADNGSAIDQAVPLFLIPSIGLAVWSLARTPFIARTARAALVSGAALGVAAFVVALATRDAAFVWVAVPGSLVFAAGLVVNGVCLLRLRGGVPVAGPSV